MTKDFGITYTYAKLVQTIVESYMNYKEKQGVDAKCLPSSFGCSWSKFQQLTSGSEDARDVSFLKYKVCLNPFCYSPFA